MGGRQVKRVLVMLDYGLEDSNSGEVFEITELVSEMLERSPYCADISLTVRARKSYRPEPAPRVELSVSWGGNAVHWVHGATHLEDVVNSALPDGERVTNLKKRAKRLRKKAEAVDVEAMTAKLLQVAGVRHQHPIARVNEVRPLLEAASDR